MNPKRWPSHLPPRREFCAMKRSQIRKMRMALAVLRLGSGFLPSGAGKVNQIGSLLDELQAECSVKRWGR